MSTFGDDIHMLRSESPERTLAIGRRLGEALLVGDVLGLVGPLGAGKTALAKGIAGGIGVADPRRVTSPTVVIVNEYDARLRLYHIDAYRLGGVREIEALGLDEFMASGAVVVEWSDRVRQALPEDHLTITIEPIGDHTRELRLMPFGPRSRDLARHVASSLTFS